MSDERTSAFPFGELEPNPWSRDVYVVGGGYSLHGFDFSVLRGRGTTIGCNMAGIAAECDVVFSLDRQFHRMYAPLLREAVGRGQRVVIALPPTANPRTDPVIEGALYLVRRRGPVISRSPRDVHGVHSGFGALNLAVLGGAEHVHLLGIDMRVSAGKPSHFHDGSRPSAEVGSAMRGWLRTFEQARPSLEEAGVRVTNYVGEPHSLIECFEALPLSALQQPREGAA